MSGTDGKSGCRARPSIPLSQPLNVFVRRSATMLAVVSWMPSNTFRTPLFSVTNTRPSLENSTDVGRVRPSNTT